MTNSEENSKSAGDNKLAPHQKIERRVWFSSIVASILSSAIFLLFFQPILDFLSGTFIGFGNKIFSRMIDSYYATAVSASISSILYEILSFIVLLSSSVPISLIIFTLLLSFISQDKNRREKISSSKSISIIFGKKSTVSISIATIIFTAFSAIFFITGAYIKVQARASFDVRMMALAPHATQIEKDKLMAQWAWVRSKREYEAVMNSIECVARSHNASLPQRFI